MNKTTKYREQLLYYLDRDKDYDAMIVWIEKQPQLDQPGIFRELTAILRESHHKTGEQLGLETTTIFNEIIGQVEEEILNLKLAENGLITEFENVEFDMEQIVLLFDTTREAIIESILANSENNNELWDLAQQAIKAEKESGLYDPANWSAVFPL
jgi:hypothetical protein